MSHSAYQGFPVKLLPKSLEILHSLSFSVAINSKIHVCCGRSRNLSVVKSQSYFISERLFFPLREQQGKIAKLMKYITYLLLWESGFLASVMLDDAHQAASYQEIKTDGCELTKSAYITNHTWAIIITQWGKKTASEWLFSETLAFRGLSFHFMD